MGLAVNTSKIQETIPAGTIQANDNSGSSLSGTEVTWIKGECRIIVTRDAEKLMLTRPPSADWTSGLTTETHYSDTGPVEVQVRSTGAEPAARFFATSKDIRAYGSVTKDVRNGTATFFGTVELVKSDATSTSGVTQAPSVKTIEVRPISPETSAKILERTSEYITPPPDKLLQQNGGTIISGDVVVQFGETLAVYTIEQQWRIT